MLNRVQYASNLFVDINKHLTLPSILKPSAPHLVLAGGIANMINTKNEKTSEFLAYCSKNFEKTLWVPGQYENAHPDRFNIKFSRYVHSFKNVHVVLNTVYKVNTDTLQNIIFIGTPYSKESDKQWVYKTFSNYRFTKDNIVIVSAGIPHLSLKKSDIHERTPLYPDANAWICSSPSSITSGGNKVMRFSNGIIATYNSYCKEENKIDGNSYLNNAVLTIPPNKCRDMD